MDIATLLAVIIAGIGVVGYGILPYSRNKKVQSSLIAQQAAIEALTAEAESTKRQLTAALLRVTALEAENATLRSQRDPTLALEALAASHVGIRNDLKDIKEAISRAAK